MTNSQFGAWKILGTSAKRDPGGGRWVNTACTSCGFTREISLYRLKKAPPRCPACYTTAVSAPPTYVVIEANRNLHIWSGTDVRKAFDSVPEGFLSTTNVISIRTVSNKGTTEVFNGKISDFAVTNEPIAPSLKQVTFNPCYDPTTREGHAFLTRSEVLLFTGDAPPEELDTLPMTQNVITLNAYLEALAPLSEWEFFDRGNIENPRFPKLVYRLNTKNVLAGFKGIE